LTNDPIRERPRLGTRCGRWTKVSVGWRQVLSQSRRDWINPPYVKTAKQTDSRIDCGAG